MLAPALRFGRLDTPAVLRQFGAVINCSPFA
jgi:hypothetical protein